MILTKFQKLMNTEREKTIKKFQKKYKSSIAKELALRRMSNKDIYYLIYCSNNIYANIFYSKFIKKEK